VTIPSGSKAAIGCFARCGVCSQNGTVACSQNGNTLPLKAWFAEVVRAKWKAMVDIKRQYVTASVVDSERVVFNIGGNKYRLVVKIWFPGQLVWIKFVGTHRSYDQIDVEKL
jgi:mRNA interferase HigB